jgi:hypothetical protein
MRVNKLFPLFVLLVLTLTSCGHSYKVEGTTSVSYMDGKLLYLKVLQNDKWINVDSAEVIHGTFKMKGKIDSIMVASLYMDDQSLMPVVLESGTIKINISDNEMRASGTSLNDKLYAFLDKKNELDLKAQDMDHLQTQMLMNGKDEEEISNTISRKSDSIVNALSETVKKFISENYNNAVGPFVFIMVCGDPPMMTPQIEDILKDAPETFKKNALVNEFITKARENAEMVVEQQRMEQNEDARSQQAAQNPNAAAQNPNAAAQNPNAAAQQSGQSVPQ